eukprot:Amastigsp_a864439_4.p2 type:complete len:102 gc:universal Amastigsp_a864439_4:327-22(-)
MGISSGAQIASGSCCVFFSTAAAVVAALALEAGPAAPISPGPTAAATLAAAAPAPDARAPPFLAAARDEFGSTCSSSDMGSSSDCSSPASASTSLGFAISC